MMRRLLSLCLTAALALAFTAPIPAAAFDCRGLRNVGPEKAYKQNVRQIERCIQHGWDPPVNWRPDRGRGTAARVSGGGGFNITTVQAPEKPPALRGFGPSVGQAKMRFALQFPPWPGFPCQLPGGFNMCKKGGGKDDDNGNGGGGGGEGDDETVTSCPVNDDTTGTFGQKVEIGGKSGNYTLSCGGAVPLSSYQITLSRNPTGMIATEYGSPYLWAYKTDRDSSGNTTLKAVGGPIQLPTYLCRRNGKDMEKSLDLTAPIAQMIVYNGSSVAIRLTATEGGGETTERYLIVPIRNGVPQVPANCADEDEVFKPLVNIGGDLTFESTVAPSCEGPPQACGGGTPGSGEPSGGSASGGVVASASCEAVTVYPKGEAQTPQGTVDCGGTSQMMVVDRPNLLLPPNSRLNATGVEGRSAVLAAATAGSKIYTSSDAIIRLNRGGSNFEMPEGGVILMEDGRQFIMNGPASINTVTGSVSLYKGGEVRNEGGTAEATYKPGASARITASWPLTIRLNRNIEIPEGYFVPTQPAPHVRAPINQP